MARSKRNGTLSAKSRVIATKGLVGVPMGTPGRIEVVNGLTWTRFWVQFDNGVWLGSVDAGAVVAERDWPDLQLQRVADEARAAEEAARPPVEAAPVAAAEAPAEEAGASSKIPAALLARSQAAKAKKAAAAAE